MKTTVIHHSGDWDGRFCCEIARRFLPVDTEFIGWDFGDPPFTLPEGRIYVMDLPVDEPFGFTGSIELMGYHFERITWIDHHATSITSHPTEIPGYRIDGVGACRLCWQWFERIKLSGGPKTNSESMPSKQDFLDRKVSEPLAVRLAGEYDVWDHRGDGDVEFQFGLDAQKTVRWDVILQPHTEFNSVTECLMIVNEGKAAMQCYKKRDADVMRSRSFLVEWEGLKFLCLNTARCHSNTFAERDVPETGHDALMGFYYNGNSWAFSLYHAKHRRDLDLSLIAVKHGGGGHRGAARFTCHDLPL